MKSSQEINILHIEDSANDAKMLEKAINYNYQKNSQYTYNITVKDSLHSALFNLKNSN